MRLGLVYDMEEEQTTFAFTLKWYLVLHYSSRNVGEDGTAKLLHLRAIVALVRTDHVYCLCIALLWVTGWLACACQVSDPRERRRQRLDETRCFGDRCWRPCHGGKRGLRQIKGVRILASS